MKKVLTIAGSDCSGGAGIQADLKTIGAWGCYGMSVITAVTVQNTCGVRAVYPVEAEVVQQQFTAVYEDIFPDAVKIGMLCNEEIIEAVAETIQTIRKMSVVQPKIVLDPVLVSTSGRALLEPQAKEALQTKLFPLVDLITPNLGEMKVLCGVENMEVSEREAAGRKLAKENDCGVLIKGGHGREYGDSDAQDLLIPGGGQAGSMVSCSIYRESKYPRNRLYLVFCNRLWTGTRKYDGTECTKSKRLSDRARSPPGLIWEPAMVP